MTTPSERDQIVAWLRENEGAMTDQWCEPVIPAVVADIAQRIESGEYLPANHVPQQSIGGITPDKITAWLREKATTARNSYEGMNGTAFQIEGMHTVAAYARTLDEIADSIEEGSYLPATESVDHNLSNLEILVGWGWG